MELVQRTCGQEASGAGPAREVKAESQVSYYSSGGDKELNQVIWLVSCSSNPWKLNLPPLPAGSGITGRINLRKPS